MIKPIVAAAAVSIAWTAGAAATEQTYAFSGDLVFKEGTLAGLPDNHGLGGQWTIDDDFSKGRDQNEGIPSPTYAAQIDFDISSFLTVLDPSGDPVPGENFTTDLTALFYQDDVFLSSATLASVGLDGLVAEGTYDIFELNASETIGVQDPETGEFSPAAPPGEGTAHEGNLVVLGASDWFSGPQGSLLALPDTYEALILVTDYNESGAIVGRASAFSSGPVTASAAAAVPLPAAGWLLLAGIGALAAARRR